jgi:TonB family protein
LIEVTILHSHPQNQTPRSNEIAMDLSIKTDPKISEDHSAHEIRDKEFLKTAKKQPKSEETTTSKPQKDPLKTAAKNETLKDPIPEVPQTGYTDLTQAQNVDAKDLKSLYLTKIRNKIAQNQIYPKASLVFKEQGTVEIKLSIKKDGSILKIELQKASQFNHLNDAALQAVANSSPFEAIPESLNYKDWVLLLPIKFKIE